MRAIRARFIKWGPFDTLRLILVYGLDSGALVFLITVATSLSNEYLQRWLIMVPPYVRKPNVAILIVAGTYMILSSLLS